jgi:serine/threonine protein kinase/formylglycine-generating enzyme required for sulfatase activity
VPDTKTKIGKYEILSILGKGAMGVVYKARDPIIERLVAIKTQHLEMPDAQTLRLDERFVTEARAVGRLNHPNIVGLYDFGQDKDCAYIVMELASGFQLTEFVNRNQPITTDEIWDTILKVLDGLQYAHDYKVIHRDIKPANIMRDTSGNVKITDFGIAQIDTSSLTNTGLIIGTPRYMAPERIKGEKGDHTADIFSCGVVLHELLTGQLAFHDTNSAAVIYKIINTELPPISELCADCPAEMDAVIEKAVAKDPAERYRSAHDFAEGIRKVLDESKSAVINTESDATLLHQLPTKLADDSSATSIQESELRADPGLVESDSATEPELDEGDSPTDPGLVESKSPTDPELVESDSPTDPGLVENEPPNDAQGPSKRSWVLLLIILAIVIIVFTVLQVFKDHPADDDPAPMVMPVNPSREVIPAQETESEILPAAEPEAKKQTDVEKQAFSKITIGAIFSDCPDCPSMIVIPPEEQAGDTVATAQPFAAAQFEVSRGEYATFVSATDYNTSGCLVYERNEWLHREQHNWQAPGYDQDDTHPAVCISWVDANNYVSWISDLTGKQYRLLSSSEWEYLARGGHDESKRTNDSLKNICQFANVADTSALKTYPGWVVHDCEDLYVHTSPANNSQFKANDFGVSGLLGNAFEWVSDCWKEEDHDVLSDGSDRLTGDCSRHVLRGGSWFSQPDYVRFGFENRFDSNTRASTFGFRIARDLDSEETIPTGGEPGL